jgi:hypothetical protein
MVTAEVSALGPAGLGRSVAYLLRDVREARADLQLARRTPGRERLLAQAHLVAALVIYTEALTSVGLPVPYLLRDELRIHSDALGSPR